MVLSIVSSNGNEGAWLFLVLLAPLAFSALSQSSNSSFCLFCNSYLQLTNLLLCMLVVQYQTQNFRQKKVAKEMLGSSSETMWKILKGKFATNLKKHIASGTFNNYLS